MDFSYKAIFKNTWQLVWRHKILWLLALFITQGTVFLNLISETDSYLILRFGGFAALKGFITLYFKSLTIWQLIFFLMLMLGGSILSLLCKAGLLSQIREVEQSGKFNIISALKFGYKKIKDMFFLEVFFFIPIFIVFSIIVLFWLYVIADWPRVVAVVVLYAFLIFISLFKLFAYNYVCFRDLSAFSALKSSWQLFARHLKISILVNLIYAGVYVTNILLIYALLFLLDKVFFMLMFWATLAKSDLSMRLIYWASMIFQYGVPWLLLALCVTFGYALFSKTFSQIEKA